ncbi:WD40 repeat domain-containing protein [Plantactinospora mayteni]|nr:hypothetical protein [Plantactinospora mayteni]
MSTDLYGVRVLSVDPEELRIRFKVFVVYYDTAYRSHESAPDDVGFFFHLLWQQAIEQPEDSRAASLARLVDMDHALDFEWVDANARRFVSRVERVAAANHPPTEEQWERLHDFYYEDDGGWKDEDLLVQFEYDVWVTDQRWLEPLRAGDAWGTTGFPVNADTWTAEESSHIPDLSNPAQVLHPFRTATGDLSYDHISSLAFSDDGRYLATCSDQNRVWVHDTADWTELLHTSAGEEWIVPQVMWVPGEHIVTVKTLPDDNEFGVQPQWAFDVDARTEVEAPFQAGLRRSHDGAYRIGPNGAGEGGYDLLPTAHSPHRQVAHAGQWDPIQCEGFSGDGSRLFLGAQENLYVVDPATGEVVDTVLPAPERLFALAANPDGNYLAVGSHSRKLHYLTGRAREQCPYELCVWRMADKKIIMGRQLTARLEHLAWSPDGRWLVVAMEPTAKSDSHDGQTALVVFAMGPVDDAPVSRAKLRPGPEPA